MATNILIHWNGFLTECCENYPNESCAFLFASTPYGGVADRGEEWWVWSVKNIAENPQERWIPEKKEMQKVKNVAKKLKLTKIGNIHSHPIHQAETPTTLEDIIEDTKIPSDLDLKFARKHNDIIRGIIVAGKDAIYTVYFHDQYGREVKLNLSEGT
jgi:hypothetical protein